MNTKSARTAKQMLFSAIAFACSCPVFADLAIVGQNGQILLYVPSAEPPLTAVIESLSHRRSISESYFASSEKKLFVSDDTGKLSTLDFSALSKRYQRVDTGEDLVSVAVWYDAREMRPAWLHVMDKESVTHVRFQKQDGTIYRSQHADIMFKGGFIFGMHIDGWKTTGTLAGMSSDLAVLPAKYPDDQWIIVGRSKKIAAYIRKPAIPVKTGETVTATLLFQDRIRNRWNVETMDEYCQVNVYADVAVLCGLHVIKGDKDPTTGNNVQAKPSGKWYFYDPSKKRVATYELGSLLTVQYATASEAFLSGEGQLLRLPLGNPEHAKPEFLAKLPPGFSVVAIFPVR
ncbi:MAG: hypothetical protein RBU24_15780 [Kiritimatiellia bacterium]|nr:hypothetical protein [Kiritimatiellia bacterium]